MARACRDYGQCVQFSVFECEVDPAQWVKLKDRLLKEIDPLVENMHAHRLTGLEGWFTLNRQPGETVRARLTQDKKDFARADFSLRRVSRSSASTSGASHRASLRRTRRAAPLPVCDCLLMGGRASLSGGPRGARRRARS